MLCIQCNLINNKNNNNKENNSIKKTFELKFYSAGSVKVDAELIFNQVENAPTPDASAVTSTLVEAASSSNFSLPVNTSSIVATGKNC